MNSEALSLFASSFGTAPAAASRAPGRVEVLGNHTDYNEGFVLSSAIDRGVYAAAAPSPDGVTFELVSTQYPEKVTLRDAERSAAQRWVKYPLGVYQILQQGGYPVKPFRLAVHSDLPMGSGLSSSAALEVATGLCLCRLFNITIEPVDLAKICQRAENEIVGANCGLLDQFSSLLGQKNQLLFIDFRTLSYRTVPLSSSDLCIALTPSGVTHSLVQSAYNDRRRECAAAADFFAERDPNVRTLRDVSMETLEKHRDDLEKDVYHRARHIIGENNRVSAGIALLEKGDLSGFGRLLFKSHESSRLNFENSCQELDLLVAISRDITGVYGSRLSGGGFGGAMLSLLSTQYKSVFEKTVCDEFRKAAGRETSVMFASAGDGASLVEI